MNTNQSRTLPTLASLRSDVYTLATPQGRRVGDPGHDAARQFLIQRLTDCNLAPYTGNSFELPYDGGSDGTMTNLVGVLTGSDPSLPPVLLGAHYDTCGALPGADDNAAAVAAVLAAVEPLRQLALKRSVIIALFDGEEPPHFQTETMGSNRFYAKQRTGPIAAAIVLDLVGHQVPLPGLEDLLFVLGAESCPDIASAVQKAPVPVGLRVLPTHHDTAPDMSDHTAFRRAGRPFLFLSCGHGPDYHCATDTPDKIDYPKLAAVSAYVVALTVALENAPLTKASVCDTTSLEVERWEQCWTGDIAARFGVPTPRNRGEIDRMTRLLTQRGGL